MASWRSGGADQRAQKLALARGRCQWRRSGYSGSVPPKQGGRDSFFRKLFNIWGQPRVTVTDNLRSYGAAKVKLVPGIGHRQHKGLNNRVEASHRHRRRREKIMGRFKSPGQAQLFLSVHNQTPPCFAPNATNFQPDLIATHAPMPSIFGSSMHTSWRLEINT